MAPESGQTRLVLASASPRRRDLLAQCKISFAVDAPHIDETVLEGESAHAYVERLAGTKAEVVSVRHPGAWVLAADTSVVDRGEILGKPRDGADAERMLAKLSGQEHRVMTGIALARAGARHSSRVVETQVHFRALSPEEISWYVQTGEPMDKAGAYAIQGIGAFAVRHVVGSVTNVIGLPLVETLELLRAVAFPLPWSKP